MRLICALFLLVTCAAPTAEARATSDLNFTIQTGTISNHFFRQGNTAAHLSLRSGDRPRIITAFPAGNAGVGLWFADATKDVQFASVGDLQAIHAGSRHGIRVNINADVPKLTTKYIALGSIRFLRAYDDGSRVPPEVAGRITATSAGVQVERPSFDGKHSYALTLRPAGGTKITVDAVTGAVSFERQVNTGLLGFELTALTDETPLTPMPLARLLQQMPRTADEMAMANALAFLTYEEKILAGSWHFLTYFGRDSLLSAYLLKAVAGPAVLETALAAVFERLAVDGRVAHEEDIGDWAAYRHLAAAKMGADPIYDYKMVDSDFLPAIVAAAYFADPNIDPARSQAFLQRRTTAGITFKTALLSNMRLVLSKAQPYSDAPSFNHLIHLRVGEIVGDWRDSTDGLGGGVYPYSVNVAFVPAALRAIEQLASGALQANRASASLAVQAHSMGAVWQYAGSHFAVAFDHELAAAALLAFNHDLGLSDPTTEIPAAGHRFHALALTEEGEPIPVQHSDQGFNLLFNDPPAVDLEEAVDAILQPFPLGLLTPVGLVVANPAFTVDPPLWNLFTTNHYHGTVVWSWQQAVFLTGLRRQALRTDISVALHQRLTAAADRLEQVIALAPSHGREELWTFHLDHGVYRGAPFGADLGDKTESNPVQLWSTVFYGMGVAFGKRSAADPTGPRP